MAVLKYYCIIFLVMNTPTKITFSRIILVVLLILFLATIDILGAINHDLVKPFFAFVGNTHISVLYLAICIVFIVASLTDALDGYLARKNNQVTDLGKFLDPVADKLLVNSLLIYLTIGGFVRGYTNMNQYIIPTFCVIIMVGRDIVVDSLRFIAAKKNIVIAANIFGKAKTVAQMVTIPIVLLNGWPFTYFDFEWNRDIRIVAFLVYITTLLSLISGIIYVVQNRNVLKDGSRKTNKRSK